MIDLKMLFTVSFALQHSEFTFRFHHFSAAAAAANTMSVCGRHFNELG